MRKAERGPAALARARDGFRAWLFDAAFPFWNANGFGASLPDGSRPAAEQITLDGATFFPGYTRIRVQARQLFVYAIAAEHGVPGAAGAAEGIFRFMLRHGRASDGHWIRRTMPDGRPVDETADLYDIAFVLFALAHHARVFRDPRPLREAERTLDFLRREMTHPGGGFHHALPVEPGWRLQNPHMHLLEAALALFEASGDARWAELARELVGLFHDRFFDAESGTLAEHFSETLHRAGGIDGDLVEPGHQMEWIWLLDRGQTLLGDPLADRGIRALDRIRDGHGVGRETGLMRDAIGRDGRLLRGSSRLWPQGELLRAGCVLHRRAENAAEAGSAADTVLDAAGNLLDRFLVGPKSTTLPPGTWIDQLDAFGRPAIRMIPASSFYHIVTAWIELEAFQPQAQPTLTGF
ncbi:AGE family epimerase/isomerase [Acetobacteraceae bacterium KSS8]|uniref:AGE family epimerase/isomerase n=1 Tax=Endosaccharibacter trunci TaxID=2812733 RepID=A0ABT1W4T2_9PROT|nr:AGE family epimerase/isomerase [Acetobacteraceae bacterium KSS8]